jgi:hypothetical protein
MNRQGPRFAENARTHTSQAGVRGGAHGPSPTHQKDTMGTRAGRGYRDSVPGSVCTTHKVGSSRTTRTTEPSASAAWAGGERGGEGEVGKHTLGVPRGRKNNMKPDFGASLPRWNRTNVTPCRQVSTQHTHTYISAHLPLHTVQHSHCVWSPLDPRGCNGVVLARGVGTRLAQRLQQQRLCKDAHKKTLSRAARLHCHAGSHGHDREERAQGVHAPHPPPPTPPTHPPPRSTPWRRGTLAAGPRPPGRCFAGLPPSMWRPLGPGACLGRAAGASPPPAEPPTPPPVHPAPPPTGPAAGLPLGPPRPAPSAPCPSTRSTALQAPSQRHSIPCPRAQCPAGSSLGQ